VQFLRPALERHRDDVEVTPVLLAGSHTLQALVDTEWGKAISEEERALLVQWSSLSRSLRVSEPDADTREQRWGDSLSLREAQVLERIAAGDSNKVIARMLDLSPHTVKRHVANILDKLGATSRGQAVALWRLGQARAF
jgi:LuxR family maltose regulon positive regulatory protein